jgi:hypothetical protein
MKLKYHPLAGGVLIAVALQIWIIHLGIMGGSKLPDATAPGLLRVPLAALTNIPPPPPPPRAPSTSFRDLSDYEVPTGAVLYTSNPEHGDTSSVTTPVDLSVAIMSRTDSGPPSLSTAKRSCDGNFYLEVRSHGAPPHTYYVRPDVPYNRHLRMTWLQACRAFG